MPLLTSRTLREPAAETRAPAADLTGRWDVRIEYAAGSSTHTLHLRQKGNEVDGTHQGDFVARDLSGTINGSDVSLRSNYGGQTGDALSFTFTGKVVRERDVGRPRHGRVSGREVDARGGSERKSKVECRKPSHGVRSAGFPPRQAIAGRAKARLFLRAIVQALLLVAFAVLRRTVAPRPIRPAAARRPPDRCAQQHQTPSETWRFRQGRLRPSRRRSIPLMPSKTVDVSGLFISPGIVDIHTHVYAGTGEAAFVCRRQQRLSRHRRAPLGRDDGCRHGQLRVAQLRRFQAAHHRSRVDSCPRVSEHRRPRDARREVRAGSERHGGAADRRHGAPLSRDRRRHQDGALFRTRMGAGRAGRRSGHARQPAGDGGLRRAPARAAAVGARDERSCGRATSTRTCTRDCAASRIRRAR